VAGEVFKASTKADMLAVPYKGGAPAMTDTVGGTVPVIFDALGPAMPFIKGGKVRALAVTSAARSPLLPDVPTLAEAGVPNAEMLQWFAVMGPARMPPEITRKLNTEIAAILKMPDVVEKIASQGGEIIGGTPEEFAAFLPGDSAGWVKLVREANVKAD
jgi:tripartite-type tricarboxylate transporter receptor subunit TctC